MYAIFREHQSGGKIAVRLTKEGKPKYCRSGDLVAFDSRDNAEKYLKFCQKTLPTYKGQTGWKVERL